MWGPPCGRDSAPSESHHKSEIKAPAKNTQCNASTLIGKTTNRQTERMLLQTATYDYQLDNETESIPKRSPTTGAKFSIMKSTDGSGTMK